ncbi:MAG TPA: CdaR family protein [Pyrinomonadaceae bacterium]|jgi:YbbR domain-containing protein|nr:CdaR family protein [Pyrinomonadaceae bacterium]
MARKLFAKHLFRKVFFEDWGLKLVALVITFALWFGVTGLSTPTVKRFTVQLVPSISNNAEITNQLISDVDIVLSGDKRKLEQLNRNDLTATLDLTDIPPGDRVVSLSPDNVYVNLPQGVKLTEVQPGRIAVNLEAVEEKDVEVDPQTTGKPAEGFDVYSATAVPPRVRVRGPASLVKTMDFVSTDPVDVSGKKDGFTARQIAVKAADPKAAVFNTVVDVFVRIGEKRVERTFMLSAPGFPGKTVSFTVYGPRSAIGKLKQDDIKVLMVLGDTGDEVPQITLPAELQDTSEIRKVRLN